MPSTKKSSEELISLTEASQRFGLKADYLRQLAIKGRLKARKIARNWVTTPLDVETYLKSRKKIGAFREDPKIPQKRGSQKKSKDLT